MKPNYMGLIFTKHAINRLYNRGISQEKAYETFANPDGQITGKTPGSVKFYKNYGKQRIEVIAKKNNKNEWIVFSCWAKFKEKIPSQYQEPILQKLISKLIKKIFK